MLSLFYTHTHACELRRTSSLQNIESLQSSLELFFSGYTTQEKNKRQSLMKCNLCLLHCWMVITSASWLMVRQAVARHTQCLDLIAMTIITLLKSHTQTRELFPELHGNSLGKWMQKTHVI